jgi:hypothetical protein
MIDDEHVHWLSGRFQLRTELLLYMVSRDGASFAGRSSGRNCSTPGSPLGIELRVCIEYTCEPGAISDHLIEQPRECVSRMRPSSDLETT